MFFDSAVFINFAKDCKKWGIDCPVVPGLMCINAYPGFAKMTKFCKTRVPDKLGADMEAIKDDVVAVKQYGIDFGAQVCRELLASGTCNVLHFYTLNLEKVVYGVLDALGLSTNALGTVNEADAASQVAKGSAWARVGDKVKTLYGAGVVKELTASGAAAVEIESWLMAGGQKPTAYLQKGSFTKIF
jgi:methylenetetrahydrofolate reductase (NADPH)